MAKDPDQRLQVDIGQSAEERHELIEELEQMSHEDDGPPPPERGKLTSEEEFEALQAQGLGAGALGTDPITD
jgi:hypothetical protein